MYQGFAEIYDELMNDVNYEYKDGSNILSFKKTVK